MAGDPDAVGGEPDMQAGEFALGLLSGEERAAALRRLLADRAFAREVDAWRERLSPFDDEIAAEDPPAGTWRGIEQRLVVPAAGTAVRWKATTAAMTAVAAALLATVVLRAPPPQPTVAVAPPAPASRLMLVAQLAPPSATALLTVYDDGKGGLIVRPAVVNAPNLDPELWVIPKGSKPVSLGVIARDRPTRLQPGGRRALLVRDATLAVSLEPIGGSPTGQPTGPVVAAGTIATL